MAKSFYQRLGEYYENVAAVLRGEANAASIFPNPTDIGSSRESIYAEFLKQHAPSKCNVFFGGFLFHESGDESSQMDLIVSTDTSPQFNFHNSNNSGKSFCPIEGCLGAVSIKSMLDRTQLFDALTGIASIPPMSSLKDRVALGVGIKKYEEWPLKIIYSTKGISLNSLIEYINEFYSANTSIPESRRPDIIHVSGQYLILKAEDHMHIKDKITGSIIEKPKVGSYIPIDRNPDVEAIVWTLNNLQQKALASTHIFYNYDWIVNNIYR